MTQKDSAMDQLKHQLNTTLKRLMVECDIDDIKLASATGVPFTTIARMRSNPEANPTASSLRPLAKYFGISISQLLGDEPLAPDRLTKATLEKIMTPTRVPVIPWDKITNWAFDNKSNFDDITGWISVDLPTSASSYAVKIENSAFGPGFPQHAILVADPNVSPQSGDYILIKLNNDPNILLKEILLDGKLIYLKSVNPELKHTLTLSEPYKLCATIVEIRKTLHTESFSDIKHRSKQQLETAVA